MSGAKKNIIILLLLLIPFFAWASDTLQDSYSETNKDNNNNLNTADSGVDCHAHSFTTLDDGVSYKITSAKFYLAKISTPTGNIWAELYAHSGTYGTNSLPTGSALGTSATQDITTLGTDPTYTLIEFLFSGADQYEMSANTNYVIAVCTDTAVNSKYLAVGFDSTSSGGGAHAGNSSQHILPSTWGLYGATTSDTPFYVYGLAPSVASTPRQRPALIFFN